MQDDVGQLAQGGDGKANGQSLWWLLVVQIEPAGIHAGTSGAFDVRREGVADHQRPLPVKVGDACKDIVKIFLQRFLIAAFLRYKDAGKVRHQTAGIQTAALGSGDTVGQDIQPAAGLIELLAALLRIRHRLAAVAEVKQVFPVKVLAVDAGDAKSIEQLCKAGGQQLLAGDELLFKLFPQSAVDLLVKLVDGRGKGEMMVLKGANQRLMFGIGKVHQRFVCIQKDDVIFHVDSFLYRFYDDSDALPKSSRNFIDFK